MTSPTEAFNPGPGWQELTGTFVPLEFESVAWTAGDGVTARVWVRWDTEETA